MQYRIRIVPKATPNAEGEWLRVEADMPATAVWLDAMVELGDRVPDTHFLVEVQRVHS